MHWLLLLLAVGALAVALMTSSVGLAAVCVLAALVLLVGWVLGWYSARVGARSRDESAMIDPGRVPAQHPRHQQHQRDQPADRGQADRTRHQRHRERADGQQKQQPVHGRRPGREEGRV